MKYGTHNPKPQKNMWAVIYRSGTVANWTLAWTKKQSIEKYMQDFHWVKDKEAYCKKQRSRGTRCVKVNVTFEPVKKPVKQ